MFTEADVQGWRDATTTIIGCGCVTILVVGAGIGLLVGRIIWG